MTTTLTTSVFTLDALSLDVVAETDRIVTAIRHHVLRHLRRKGVVLGLSGGIDSSVTAALCVKALGENRVFGLLMPERDSSDESLRLGQLLAETYGIATQVEDISDVLAGAGCYRRRDAVLRQVFPAFGPECRWKIVLPSLFGSTPYRVFSVVIQTRDGLEYRQRLPLEVYQEVLAATNFKQRVRKMMEYYHADRSRYAVAGTPNLLEYDQGFFVKLGDGAADLKPICAPVQITGLPNGGVPGSAGGNFSSSAYHRHVLARTDAGRILLFAPLRPDGRLFVRPLSRCTEHAGCRCPGTVQRAGGTSLPRYRRQTTCGRVFA